METEARAKCAPWWQEGYVYPQANRAARVRERRELTDGKSAFALTFLCARVRVRVCVHACEQP